METVCEGVQMRDRAAPAAWVVLAIASLTAFGLVLRLAAARGDLWLDELWTFRLIEGGPSLARIVFGLPHVNNHVLNTVWFALVGPNASPLVVRLPAVMFGTLCIPVAARIGARRHPVAAVAAAALVAVDNMLVHYGSEARGYSGMILGLLIAFDQLDIFLDAPNRRGPLVTCAAAVAFGTFCHLTMIAGSLVLAATTGLRAASLERPVAIRAIASVGLALAIGTAPAILCLAISIAATGVTHTGLVTPFTWSYIATGLARAASATTGLPYGPVAAPLLVTACASVIALIFVGQPQRPFPALAIFGLPALQAALHLPNEQFARFHLVSSLGLVVLAIEVAARGARSGRAGQLALLALAAGMLAGQSRALVRLLEHGRGSFAAPVALLGTGEPATVMVEPDVVIGETAAVIRWYAARAHVSVATTPATCRSDAQWLLVVREPGEALGMPRDHVQAAAGCPQRFSLHASYPAYGPSGFSWFLFKRESTAG